jgi:AMMECR1 domain-containing protein
VEEKWDRDTFIEETCLKAGLPRQAWKDDDTDIFMFTALVFGEYSPDVGAFPERTPAPDRTQPPSPLGLDSPRP